MIQIFTDGACLKNPGPGGWGVLIIGDSGTEEFGGHESHTTNNRMELRAAIEGLRKVPRSVDVRVVTDSLYVYKGITQWVHSWKNRHWMTSQNQPVLNKDLWVELDGLSGKNVHWKWVRGHAGHPENERADTIAQAYAKHRTPPPKWDKRKSGKSEHKIGAAEKICRPKGKTYLSLVGGTLMRHSSWEDCNKRVRGVSGAKFQKCRSVQEEMDVLVRWEVPVEALILLNTPGINNE